jgi:putative addiction module killer protein
MADIRIIEYLDRQSRSPFAAWFEGLNAPAAAKVPAAIYQLASGNWSNVKAVGGGVSERRIDFGRGYRVYFGKDGPQNTVEQDDQKGRSARPQQAKGRGVLCFVR